jgi:hypothetical protein
MISSLDNETCTEAAPLHRTGCLAGAERRRNPRVPLHWTLYLTCDSMAYPRRTTTRDISRAGFYCMLDQPIRSGERIECDIVVPTHRSQDPDDVVYLRCRGQAVRVEKIGAGFGVACRIEGYCLVRSASERLGFSNNGNLQ